MKRPTFALASYIVTLISILYVTLDLTSGVGFDDGDRTAIIFLGVLPLLNALSDFVSLGASRYYLRAAESARTVGRRTLLWVYDAGAALGSMGMFAVSAIFFLTFAVPGDGPLIDLPAFFAAVRDNPEDYWWLAFMLLSTLIPSLVHLIILAYSAFCFTPHRLRAWIAKNIAAGAEGAASRGRDGALGLIVLCTLSLWLPTVILAEVSWLLWTSSGGLRDMTLDAAVWFHGWLLTFDPA